MLPRRGPHGRRGQVKAVLVSSAESKVDDGQVEQEDIAPEEEDVADPEEMLRPAGRIGRARGRKKFLEKVQRSVPPVVTMRLITSPVARTSRSGLTRQGLGS